MSLRKEDIVGQTEDLDWKGSARCVLDGDVLAAFNTGFARVGNVVTAQANGDLNAAVAADEVTVVAGDALVLDFALPNIDTGVYVVTALGDGSNPYVLTRRNDFDESANVTAGAIVKIEEGRVFAQTRVRLSTTGPIVLNTTPLDFEADAPRTVVVGPPGPNTIDAVPGTAYMLIGDGATAFTVNLPSALKAVGQNIRIIPAIQAGDTLTINSNGADVFVGNLLPSPDPGPVVFPGPVIARNNVIELDLSAMTFDPLAPQSFWNITANVAAALYPARQGAAPYLLDIASGEEDAEILIGKQDPTGLGYASVARFAEAPVVVAINGGVFPGGDVLVPGKFNQVVDTAVGGNVYLPLGAGMAPGQRVIMGVGDTTTPLTVSPTAPDGILGRAPIAHRSVVGDVFVFVWDGTVWVIQSNANISTGLAGEVWTGNGFGSPPSFQALPGESVISPAAIGALQNDYTPTGWSAATHARISASATALTITGFSATATAKTKRIVNVGGTHAIGLTHEDAASTPANRMTLPGSINYVLNVDATVDLWYDTVTSRWRLVSDSENEFWEHAQAMSDYATTDLTTGKKAYYRVKRPILLRDVFITINSDFLPTGTPLTVDVRRGVGDVATTTLLFPLLSIDAGESSSHTAATPYAFTGGGGNPILLNAGDRLEFYVIAIPGGTNTRGLIVTLIGIPV